MPVSSASLRLLCLILVRLCQREIRMLRRATARIDASAEESMRESIYGGEVASSAEAAGR